MLDTSIAAMVNGLNYTGGGESKDDRLSPVLGLFPLPLETDGSDLGATLLPDRSGASDPRPRLFSPPGLDRDGPPDRCSRTSVLPGSGPEPSALLWVSISVLISEPDHTATGSQTLSARACSAVSRSPGSHASIERRRAPRSSGMRPCRLARCSRIIV